MTDLDDNCGDVIAPEALARGQVLRAAVIQQRLHALFQLLHSRLRVVLIYFIVEESDAFLGLLDVPDAVAGKQEKLGVRGDLKNFDIRLGCHRLVTRFERSVVLVLKVTEGPRQGQYAIHTTVFDVAARVLNSFEFNLIVGLVVLRQLDDFSCLGQDSAGVACVGAVYLIR